jgi:hypothetical protein
MQGMEDDVDHVPDGGMLGDVGDGPARGGGLGDGVFARVSNTMDVSVDLSNASHYNVNDALQSFSIWTEAVVQYLDRGFSQHHIELVLHSSQEVWQAIPQWTHLHWCFI